MARNGKPEPTGGNRQNRSGAGGRGRALPKGPRATVLTDGKCLTAVITGDAEESLRLIPDDSVNVVVTSPPYYWARDYQVEGQIGHEDTVEEYVARLCAVFREVKRVLHPEGVFYLNIGDTYYSGNGQPHGSDPRSPSRNFMRRKVRAVDRSGWDIPKKSMIGVPWKVAFELQKQGWTLRSDIIWNRCNAFTEPTALDRPYRQYEHLFLFAKSRFYSYDRSQLGGEEDVWNIPIERAEMVDHHAPYPKALVRRCVLTGSPPGGVVLDPFVGSGTTLRVAQGLGRHGVGIELNADYTQAIERELSIPLFEKAGWEEFAQTLASGPGDWEKWPGNRLNFKKAQPPQRPKQES